MGQLSDQSVKDVFGWFGMTPTPQEVAQFVGIDAVGGSNAIADYAATKTAQIKRQAEDPLNQVLAAEKTFTSAQEAAAKGDYAAANALYDQLSGVMNEAPKLFGNLTPEQVDQYIAPIKQAFAEADATAQTGNAARGLAGSSVEANARAGEATKFKGQLLATGLDVGMKEQANRAASIQTEIARRSGLGTTETNATAAGYNLQGAAAGQLSNQAQADQALLSSLPPYLRAQVLQELAAKKAQESGHGFMHYLGQVEQGFNSVANITKSVSNIGSAGAADRFSFSPQSAGTGAQGAGLLAGSSATSSGGAYSVAPELMAIA